MSRDSRSGTEIVRVSGLAIAIIVIACAAVDVHYMLVPLLTGACAFACIAGVARWLSQLAVTSESAMANAVELVTAEETAAHVQDLLGPYPMHVAAAATRLGEIRDAAAVPCLISVLDRSAWRPEAGWNTVSEAIVTALASIGDGRALPVLNRVRSARGPEFSELVEQALASITEQRPQGMSQPAARYQETQSLHAASVFQQMPLQRMPLVPFNEDAV